MQRLSYAVEAGIARAGTGSGVDALGPSGRDEDAGSAEASRSVAVVRRRDQHGVAGPWGVSYGANLTPDRATGIGTWTEQMVVGAMRTGRHAGVGRPILPPMPWPSYAQMTDDDLKAIFAFLQSVKPISNRVPQPVIAPAPR
jgi:hypothetical protein